jgi:hypothetical protein
MRRLVYSPKAYVYIQTDEEVFNISDLVVSGSVHRKVDQVSTAEVTFQNPDRRFTQPGNPTFRPMDKITIFLQRLPGFPVQSFTGYLDSTPYYQMYPGTCTIQASCTLKRLQHTYFDPGLPFMQYFLQRYGWITDGNGSLMLPTGPGDVPDRTVAASMSDLMYASLTHIVGWDTNQIYIENLPQGLTDRIHEIYTALQEGAEEAKQEFNEWLKNWIGAGSSGSGGMGGASGDDAKGVLYADLITKWARKYNFDPALIAAIVERESEFNPGAIGNDPGGTVGQGLMQLTSPGYKAWIEDYIQAGEDRVSANLHAGCRALREKVDAAGSLWEGVKAYNGSGSAADEYMNDIKNVRYPKFKKKFAAMKDDDNEQGNDSQDKSGSASRPNSEDRPGHGNTTTRKGTRLDAIVAEANRMSELAKNGLKYSNARPPSDTEGYDCSSSVGQLLKMAGYKIDGWPATNTIKQFMKPGKDPSGRVTFWNSDVNNTAGNSVHIWVEINGRPFTTADHLCGHWKDDYYAKDNPSAYGFEPFHVGKLDEPADIPTDANVDSGGTEDTSGFGDALSVAKAAGVFTTMNFPQAVNSAESILLSGDRSLMNDQPILPFIEQLTKASMRSFMSLPNGDFFAFHPDYFGAFRTAPYWDIDDIEVLEGNIQLSDESLVTHVFVTGATLPTQEIDITRKLQTHGVVNILNAGTADFLNVDPKAVKEAYDDNRKKKKKDRKDEEDLEPFLGSIDASVAFLQRYGTRPLVEDAPFIRSHIFETFYAYQKFMLAWSRQFLTTFSFTFMPELYPGGLVNFKDHGIQMYVDEVHHSWDYGSGFTTQANLSAPSSVDGSNNAISRGMVRAWNNRKG